jgi:hypothetical protein
MRHFACCNVSVSLMPLIYSGLFGKYPMIADAVSCEVLLESTVFVRDLRRVAGILSIDTFMWRIIGHFIIVGIAALYILQSFCIGGYRGDVQLSHFLSQKPD